MHCTVVRYSVHYFSVGCVLYCIQPILLDLPWYRWQSRCPCPIQHRLRKCSAPAENRWFVLYSNSVMIISTKLEWKSCRKKCLLRCQNWLLLTRKRDKFRKFRFHDNHINKFSRNYYFPTLRKPLLTNSWEQNLYAKLF